MLRASTEGALPRMALKANPMARRSIGSSEMIQSAAKRNASGNCSISVANPKTTSFSAKMFAISARFESRDLRRVLEANSMQR